MNVIWDYIVNQEFARKNLEKIFDSQSFPSALLFKGNSGIGKEASAFAYAQSINCINRSFVPCGVCTPCRVIANYELPYINFIYPLPIGKNEAPGDDPFSKLLPDTIDEIISSLKKKNRTLIIN
jgi:DNA polymerase III delta prime subunit